MKTLIVAVLTVATAHLAYGDAEIKGSPAELTAYLSNVPGIVTLTGEGEVKSPADRAVITLKITTDHKSLAEALRANDAIRNRFMALLKEGGVAADRLHASKFSSTPKYSVFSDKVMVRMDPFHLNLLNDFIQKKEKNNSNSLFFLLILATARTASPAALP